MHDNSIAFPIRSGEYVPYTAEDCSRLELLELRHDIHDGVLGERSAGKAEGGLGRDT